MSSNVRSLNEKGSKMTKLETAVFENEKYSSLSTDASKQERQSVLDAITEEVIQKLTPEEISEHVQAIYNATIDEYAKNTGHVDVVDELVEFMSLLPQNARVLDMGCGTGRDVLFMSVSDEKFRNELMGRTRMGKTTREKFPVPTKTFRVEGIDNSCEMVTVAGRSKHAMIESGQLKQGEYPCFSHWDMYKRLENLGKFDGVWSCAALFTHTPESLLILALYDVAKILKKNGLFLTTYTSGLTEGSYDKLLLSSTGRIKYFSHPNPNEISKLANQNGLVLESEQFSDFEVGDKVIKKDLFVSQLFRKG